MGAALSLLPTVDPAGVEVAAADGTWVATFTRDARTVTLAGPTRAFAERGIAVAHGVWVRCLEDPFAGTPYPAWLAAALAANQAREDDILALAMQYLRGTTLVYDAAGLQIAGDAGYGPVIGDEMREGADFNDYLGVPWAYPAETPPADPPEPGQFRCLDCSGFVRMVRGYRGHAPNPGPLGAVSLSLAPRPGHVPRRARQICAAGPGVIVLPDTGAPPADLAKLAIGDLVCFDADADDGSAIDHIGIYLGPDTQGHRRFLSSRKSASAPTLADWQSPSLLDGGPYAAAFRAARRL